MKKQLTSRALGILYDTVLIDDEYSHLKRIKKHTTEAELVGILLCHDQNNNK